MCVPESAFAGVGHTLERPKHSECDHRETQDQCRRDALHGEAPRRVDSATEATKCDLGYQLPDRDKWQREREPQHPSECRDGVQRVGQKQHCGGSKGRSNEISAKATHVLNPTSALAEAEGQGTDAAVDGCYDGSCPGVSIKVSSTVADEDRRQFALLSTLHCAIAFVLCAAVLAACQRDRSESGQATRAKPNRVIHLDCGRELVPPVTKNGLTVSLSAERSEPLDDDLWALWFRGQLTNRTDELVPVARGTVASSDENAVVTRGQL